MGDGDRHDWSRLREHPAFESPPVPADLARRAADAGWPDGLVERAVALRIDRAAIEDRLTAGLATDSVVEWLDVEQRLMSGTLRVREATWADNDLLVDLFAHSPETVGEWEVTVERGPWPYAAFRLQEHPSIQIIEDHRVGLGVVARSVRNSVIAGEETSVLCMSSWRVRDGFRGQGFSNMLLMAPGPGVGWFGLVGYWYGRVGNASRGWLDKVVRDLADRPQGWGGEVSGLSATVFHLDPAAGPRSRRVRPVERADLPRCVDLVNRTHDGLDLFRPYSVEFLRQHLDDPQWGPKPHFWGRAFGWDDLLVLEDGGEIVACGGLWDRGENVRERWHHLESGAEHVTDPGALIDFGHAEGRADAMAELIGHMTALVAKRARSGLMVPLEFCPDVLDACAPLAPRPETRSLEVWPFVGPGVRIDLEITRPYTDLAYW